MRTNREVYGVNKVTPIPKLIITERLELLNKKLQCLNDVHYLDRNDVEIRQTNKDISFWEDINSKESVDGRK